MGKTVDQLLAENLNRLMSARHSTLNTNVALGKKSGVGQATVDRARRNQPGLSIAKVEALARAFNLEPWQLLAPDLEAAIKLSEQRLPLWPFKKIAPEDFELLDAQEIALVEERVLTLLEAAKRSTKNHSTR